MAQEFERVDNREVNEHKDGLISNKVLDNYVLHEELSNGRVEHYVTRSKVEI